MRLPFTPIETRATKRPPARAEPLDVDAKSGKEPLSLLRDMQSFVASGKEPFGAQVIEHAYAGVPGKVVVANARLAQHRIFRTRPQTQIPGARRKPHQTFEHVGDVGIGQSEVAVTPLLAQRDQTCGAKFREVAARRGQR